MYNEDRLKMLERVNFCVSDYLLGLEIPEFAVECGGIDLLLDALKVAHSDYEDVYNTLPDEEV